MDYSTEFNPSRYKFDELYKTLKEIRSNEPFFWSKRYNAWVAANYDAVLQVVRSDAFSISGSLEAAQPHGYCPAARKELANGVDWLVTENLLTGEGETHRRFRGAITSVVTPGQLRAIKPVIEDIVSTLIDKMEERGECDFVEDFAYPLAMLTTLRMIGFDDAEKDMDRIPHWVDETFKFFAKAMDDDEQVIAARNAVEFQHYIRKHIEARLESPKDDRLNAVIGTLSSEPWNLSVEEMIITFTHTFVGAGQETTKLALSNMMLHMLRDRAHWLAVIDDAGLIPGYVDEILRLDGPLLGIYRTCLQDTNVMGHQVRKDQKVFVLLGSANHDETRFPDAESLCPARHGNSPMMTFNTGKHFCVGAGLAKMEMAISLEQLTRRLPTIRLKDGGGVQYEANDVNRFISALKLKWD